MKSGAESSIPASPSLNAFVLLAHGFGGTSWHNRWKRGQIIGLNEQYAYGYHHARNSGMEVLYSEDRVETALLRYWRLGWRLLLGFDIIHALRNREAFFSADVVWTHTESQSLAAAALSLMFPKRPAPKMILQSVWLIDNWKRLGPLKRKAYRKLLEQGDILTFLSPCNTSIAEGLFPGQRIETVLFGVRSDAPLPPRRGQSGETLEVIAPGNDRHRDWKTLIDAVAPLSSVRLTIVSKTCPQRLAKGISNVRITSPDSNDELLRLYRNADLAVIPLSKNMHASGITVIQEATQFGLPVIATKTGGLEAYFDDTAVRYLPPGDCNALRNEIAALSEDGEARVDLCAAAQDRMKAAINSQHYAQRHATLSLELLGPAQP